MVRMRMIKANNVHARFTRLLLRCNQLLWGNVISICRRIGAGVAAAYHCLNHALAILHAPQKDATAFVGIGLLAVLAHGFIVRLCELDHRKTWKVLLIFDYPITKFSNLTWIHS